MNKSMLLKIAAAICTLALLACGILVFAQNVQIGTHYANADKYTAGNAVIEGEVRNLDIHWTAGKVTVAYHAQNTVEISETSKKKLSDDAVMRWWLDGDTLRVQFAKSGYFTLSVPEKELTLTLPEGMMLADAAFETTSADVVAPSMQAGNISVDTTSGDVSLEQLGAADAVGISSTSGNIQAALGEAKKVTAGSTSGTVALEQSGAADSVKISSTSGNVTASLADVGTLSATSTSGDVRLDFANANGASANTTSGAISMNGASAQSAKLGSSSGKIDVRLAAFGDLRISSTSGDVTAALPSQPGFRAKVDTTSGGFDYTIDLKKDGGEYTCGDGSASLRISTTSGDVRLTDAGEN